VFIGLFHVLREFGPTNNDGSPRTENYFFGLEEVQSFNRSDLFGAKLGNWVLQGEEFLNAAGTSVASMLIVMIPLMIAAGIFSHITARHSVAQQTAAQAANPQTAMTNRLHLYVFPIGVVVVAPFVPLGLLLYWFSNNLWTRGQQYVVFRRFDATESATRGPIQAKVRPVGPRTAGRSARTGNPKSILFDMAAAVGRAYLHATAMTTTGRRPNRSTDAED
jgi:YidC/Oxa1 family membrane protein insertase